MRCRLTSTRLLRSVPANSRSTTSGPGRCNRSFAIFGCLKFNSESALSPSIAAMELLEWDAISMVQFQCQYRSGAAFPDPLWNETMQPGGRTRMLGEQGHGFKGNWREGRLRGYMVTVT